MKTIEQVKESRDWKAACDAYVANNQRVPDSPEIAKLYAEFKIQEQCRTSFLLGFYFGQRVGL